MRTNAQTLGDDAESAVAARLAGLGWTILARNVRLGRGELDVVAVDPGPPASLVIVEVRWRATRGFGLAEETIDHRKRAHLRAAIGRLLGDGLPGGAALPGLPLRVDLVLVEPAVRAGEAFRIRHHRGIAL
ncbi:MAG: YraN family protein [Chloroflexi bacterium]|nr:YraN family protein [Chloroflexota bacterium]